MFHAVIRAVGRHLVAATIVLGAGAGAHAAEKVIYMNDWLPGGDKAIPFYALEKGLFAAEGLDVTIQSARGSSEVVTRIATGTADVGSGGLAAFLQAKAQGDVPVTVVASAFPVQPDAIFTVDGGSVTSLKDLVGKKVATATFTSSNVIWPLILANNGIDEKKITLIKVDPAALVPMLATGQVDATINWTTASPPFVRALNETGKKLKMLPWSEYGYDGYGYSVFASNKAIKERPEVVRKVVKAWLKAAQMALADPKDVARSMKVQFPEMDAKLVEEQFLTIVPLLDNAITKAEGLGALEPKRLATTWEWTAKSQNIPLDKVDPEKTVDRSFLQ